MGELKFFLGIQINQCKDGVYVHQSKYTKELLKKFNLEDCKEMNTPMHPTCSLSKETQAVTASSIQKHVMQQISRNNPNVFFFDPNPSIIFCFY